MDTYLYLHLYLQANMYAADARALLDAAPKRGDAAVVVLRCGADATYVWQRKTPGYPVSSQVGGLCLFGVVSCIAMRGMRPTSRACSAPLSPPAPT